jgi:hypothetical protein
MPIGAVFVCSSCHLNEAMMKSPDRGCCDEGAARGVVPPA